MVESSNREKDIFLAALDRASLAERANFVVQSCGSDDSLRRRIEAMLQAHGTPDSFLEKPAAALGVTVDTDNGIPGNERKPGGKQGTRLGPYKLLEPIGEGGMGVVYMAEQQEPVRRMVALKIIKPGMDSTQVLARFEAERQALAMMDHPNIAKVLDAGTTSERLPYFVMELVKGTPITTFCDANKLSPRERLELFIPVCQAIQHAHQKGVIHRDIKPSNVLIALYDDKPVPKVIDFGIAKAAGQPLTERTLHTSFGAIVGTPEYMSPEQATFNQLDIDTRSDVYSLGVLLYELLTGTTPVDKARLTDAALLEVLRVVREEEPARPSVKLSTTAARASIAATRGTEPDQLSQLMRGELDWIVMKSLEKDRGRRYETAAGLGRDVDRYLKDELVEARPPSAWYRFEKTFRKHKRGILQAVFMASVFIILLVVATCVSVTFSWFAHVAERRAESERVAADMARSEALKQRDKAAHALARNEGLRLVLQSELIRSSNPGLALLLAIEGAERHPGLLANNALLAALDANREERTLLGHKEPVAGLCFSTDGRRLLTASLDGTARLWDVETGKTLVLFDDDIKIETTTPTGNTVTSFKPMYTAVCFSPNGKQALTTSPNGRYRLWDATTGKALFLLEDPEDRVGIRSTDFNPISPARFSGDGRFVLTGYGHTRLWDAATGKQHLILKGHEGRVNWAEFSPDGKRIITASADKSARIWDANSGKELQVLKRASKSEVVMARLSPDGSRALTVDSTGGVISSKEALARLWDTQTGKELASLGYPGGRSEFAAVAIFSPDGRQVLTSDRFGNKPGLHTWDAETGRLLNTVEFEPQNAVAAFSPDGQLLATSPLAKTMDLRKAATLESIEKLHGPQGAVQAVAFSPDGQRLAASDGTGTIRLWIVAGDAERRLGHWSRHQFLALSPEGRLMASKTSNPKEVAIWDTATGRELVRLRGKTITDVTYAQFRSDGRTIFFGRRRYLNESACVGDIESGRLVTVLPGGDEYFVDADLSPDGRWAATTNDWRKGCTWDLATGMKQASWSLDEGDFNRGGVQFSSDSRWLLTGQVRGARLRDPATGKEFAVLKPVASKFGFVAGPAIFSPDGRHKLSWYHRNEKGLASIWDTNTHKELTVLKSESRDRSNPLEVTEAAFSADGAWIITGCNDSSTRLWETASGKELLVLKGAGGVSMGCISPDKTQVVSGSGSKTVYLWNAQTGEQLAVFQGHEDSVASARFLPDGRVLSVDKNGTARAWHANPLVAARARAPRELTPEERKQYEVPAAIGR